MLRSNMEDLGQKKQINGRWQSNSSRARYVYVVPSVWRKICLVLYPAGEVFSDFRCAGPEQSRRNCSSVLKLLFLF